MSAGGVRPPRPGEEVDLAALTGFLDGRGLGAGPVTVAQFPGGHSNLTYLVERGADVWVLRRPPIGAKVKRGHDMGREVAILSRLAPATPLAPRPVASCDDEAVLGAPFYLMERRTGAIIRKDTPPEFTPERARRAGHALVDALVALHRIDADATGVTELGRPQGYVARQVAGWTERYQAARTDELPVVLEVAAWLADHQPAESPRATVIHNDFKLDNLVFDEQLATVTAILDWEMATVGDPLMDLGTTLAYWVDPTDPQPLQMMRFGPTIAPGMPSRREVAARYADATGVDLGVDLRGAVFFYAFGLFKTAVVAQQIYARYQRGVTRDPRFASFIHAVRLLAEQARAAITADRLP
ncbi:MAG: phosphotransferase family protein [Kofleriaceae bacterium]